MECRLTHSTGETGAVSNGKGRTGVVSVSMHLSESVFSKGFLYNFLGVFYNLIKSIITIITATRWGFPADLVLTLPSANKLQC